MSKLQTLPGVILALVVALVLPAFASAETLSTIQNGQTDHPVWPRVIDARPLVQATRFPTLETLRKVRQGMTKLEMYNLLGHPHYGEGLAGVHEWDYVFKLEQPPSKDFITCQFKAIYDDQMKVSQVFLNPTSCASLIRGVPVAGAPAPAGPAPVKTIELSVDTLFAFDSAVLSPRAPAVIDGKVLSVLNKEGSVDGIKVTGWTDRLGSDSYNKRLSMARAQAVKNYLASHGVAADSIFAIGMGMAQPGTVCNEAERNALITCLAPDRRVSIEIRATH